MSELIDLLLEAGLIQFGWFPRNGGVEPVQFHLDLLASYPDILKRSAQELAAILPPAERLLCSVESLPLATALSLALDVPVVYSRGDRREPVHDLVGAYDIGHPTVFVSNLSGLRDETQVLADARRVGLQVNSGVSIMAVGKATTLPTVSLLRMGEMIEVLLSRRLLPDGQAKMVRAWLADKE